MSRLLLFLLISFLFLSGCGDDDEFSPILELGRFDGWVIESVESNYAEQVDSVLATVSDEDIEQTGQTRAELRASYDEDIEATTVVDICDQDDVLFFAEGFAILIQGAQACPGADDPSVLDGLQNNRYVTNFEVTQLVLTNADGEEVGRYVVEELTRTSLVISELRLVTGNLLVPDFTYTITYNFRAR